MKKQKAVQWGIGLLMACALFALIALFGDLRYAGNDDSVILRPYMGFGAAVPPAFHMTLHPILSYPLRWLSLAFPEKAWFSWMQLAFLWFACALSVKSIIGCFQKKGLALGWGVLGGAVYLVCFAMVYCCHVTFTVTAALLGASAVLQLLSIDGKRYTDGQIVRACLLALVPAVFAYGMRQVSVLPILAFCALAFAYIAFAELGGGKSRKRSWKPVWLSVAAVAAVFVLLAGGRALQIKTEGMEDDMRWQNASSEVMDYGSVSALPDEVLEKIGWTRAEAVLVNEWYFMDRNITAEAFDEIAAYNAAADQRGIMEKLQNAVSVVGGLRQKETVAWRSLWPLLAVALLCAAGLALRGEGVLWQWLCLLLGIGVAALLLLYLGWRGRLPLRAALAAFLPLAALVFGLLPACLPEKPKALGKNRPSAADGGNDGAVRPVRPAGLGYVGKAGGQRGGRDHASEPHHGFGRAGRRQPGHSLRLRPHAGLGLPYVPLHGLWHAGQRDLLGRLERAFPAIHGDAPRLCYRRQ